MSKNNDKLLTPPRTPGPSRIGSFGRTIYRAASLGAMALRRYARYRRRGRRARSYTKTSNKSKRTRDNLTTAQFDFKTQYVKKKMPRGKKRSWIRTMKKNQAMQLKDLGTKTILFNDAIQRQVPASPTQVGQNYLCFCLYGFKGLDSNFIAQGYRDLFKIFKNEPQISKDGNGDPVQGKLVFKSAILDVTIKNTYESDLEVDVYFGYHYKDTPNDIDYLAEGLLTGSTALVNPVNTQIQLNDRGCTPFELTRQLGMMRWTITKKQKFNLPVGKSIFLQHRDAGNHVISYENIMDFPNAGNVQGKYGLKNLTYDVLVIFKPTPGHTPTTQDYGLDCGVTRKYSYTVIEENQDFGAYRPNP